jgi:7-cyano-7-deazaguanine synthase
MKIPNKARVCVLASGGFDSAVLIGHLLSRGCEVYPLYVRAGHYWEKAELHWLRRYLRAVKRPKLKELTVSDAPVSGLWKSHWSLDGKRVPGAHSSWDSVYLPGRNLLLLSEAAVFCQARDIGWIAQGILKGNPFSDASPRFRAAMERAVAAGLELKIRMVAPFSKLNKAQVGALGRGLPLRFAFSCLKPNGLKHCGRCNKCEEL